MKNQYIEFGHSIGAHGIRGAAGLKLDNPADSILCSGLAVLLKPASDKSAIVVEGQIFHVDEIKFGNKIIISFKEVSDRTQMEALLPFTILVDRSDFPETSDDEIYLADLVGLKVLNPAEKLVGVVKGTYNHGSIDIIVVELKSGEELDIPFHEDFVKEVDWDKGQIHIGTIEYL